MAAVLSLKSLVNKNFRGKKTVLVGGTFDLLHPSHIRFLEESKKLGDVLIVCLTSDDNVRERKGKSRPIFNQKHRAQIVAALKPVDYVFISKKSAYSSDILRAVKPDIAVFSLDGGRKSYRKKYKPAIEKMFPKIRVRFTKSDNEFSTTRIIKYIIKKHKK